MPRVIFALCLLATTSSVNGRRVAARPKAVKAGDASSALLPALESKGKDFCKPENPCNICQGDCDNDSDCKAGLVCFKRNYKAEVPGCQSGGEGDIEHYDFCVQEQAEADLQIPEVDATPAEKPKYSAFNPKDGLCPKMVPLSADQPTPSMVIVTVLKANNLPWSYVDTPDPHVEFWTGAAGHRKEDYWMAKTPAVEDATNPAWGWSCLVTYDAVDPSISFEVFDADTVTSHDFLGRAHGNMLEIFRSDEDGDGMVEHEFQLQSKKAMPLTSGGKTSTLTVRSQVIREPSMYSGPQKQ
jgi:hypothetical protein